MGLNLIGWHESVFSVVSESDNGIESKRVLDNFCFMVSESDSGIEKVIDVDLVLCVVSESG